MRGKGRDDRLWGGKLCKLVRGRVLEMWSLLSGLGVNTKNRFIREREEGERRGGEGRGLLMKRRNVVFLEW